MENAIRRPDPACEKHLGAALWLPVLGFLALSSIFFYVAGFQIADVQWRSRAAICVIALAVVLIGRVLRIDAIGSSINAFFQSSIVSLAGLMLTYAAATTGRPLFDQPLLLIDQFFGYDWKTYATFVSNHAWLGRLLSYSYILIFFSPFLVIIALAWTDQIVRLEKFILATAIALIITAFIFALFPATTAWTHLHLSDREVAAFRYLPLSSRDWIHNLLQIRQGGSRTLVDFQGAGLIAFPSFHCEAALLFVWAMWRIRYLKEAMIVLNVLMIAATPIIGGHYVVDLAAGAAVAVAAIWMAERLYPILLIARDRLPGIRQRISRQVIQKSITR